MTPAELRERLQAFKFQMLQYSYWQQTEQWTAQLDAIIFALQRQEYAAQFEEAKAVMQAEPEPPDMERRRRRRK